MPGWLPVDACARRLGISPDDPDLARQVEAAERLVEIHYGFLDGLTGELVEDAPPFPDPAGAEVIEGGIKVVSNLRQTPSAWGGQAGSVATGLVIAPPSALWGTADNFRALYQANSPLGGVV